MEISHQDQQAILRLIEQGVAGSASRLAAISRTDWRMSTTSLKGCARADEHEDIKAPGQEFVGACSQAPGKMFLALFGASSADLLSRAFAAGAPSLDAAPPMREAAICEVSNLVINAVAGALADRCGMAFILSTPRPLRGARADIIKAAFGEFRPTGKIFSVSIRLESSAIAADCTLMLMLDDIIVNCILNALDL